MSTVFLGKHCENCHNFLRVRDLQFIGVRGADGAASVDIRLRVAECDEVDIENCTRPPIKAIYCLRLLPCSVPTQNDKHRQTSTNINKHRQTSSDIYKHQQTSTNIVRHLHTSTNINRHRQTSYSIKLNCFLGVHCVVEYYRVLSRDEFLCGFYC